MEFLLRLLAAIALPITVLLNTLFNWFLSQKKPTYPPIRNKILTKSVGELVLEIRHRKIKSEDLTRAYIKRIKDVNASLNAIVEDRFEEAIKEAQHADQLIAKSTDDQLPALFARYPLLGIPFTCKEACGVKGLSLAVGNVHRLHEKAGQNSEVVENLRAAGCIPLAVSANPEFCLSFETNTHIHGKCLNPYDLRRTSAGSSGGEGSLNGSGATTFGLASDIAGSIRLPSLFCGVFGHKPTGGLISIKGHFPHSDTDPDFPQFLQLGPITRFAKDLPILLQIMAGENAKKLNFADGVQTKDIKIFYCFGFSGLNGLFHPVTDFDIKLAIIKAVKYFEKGGLQTKEVTINSFHNSMEAGLSNLIHIKGIPSILTGTTTNPRKIVLVLETLKSLIGHSLHTKEALFMELMQSVNAFINAKRSAKWRAEAEVIKNELLELLGNDGVFFFPTFYTTALCFHMTIPNLLGIDMLVLFNVLGFPSTHVPMGLDHRGMPIGFQVVAAPYQDKLCLQIAAELERAFNGWVPPLRHQIRD